MKNAPIEKLDIVPPMILIIIRGVIESGNNIAEPNEKHEIPTAKERMDA